MKTDTDALKTQIKRDPTYKKFKEIVELNAVRINVESLTNEVKEVSEPVVAKAIEDLRPLIKQASLHGEHSDVVTNEYIYSLNIQDYLYYISSTISLNANNSSIDNQKHIIQSVSLISHENANKFKSTSTNLPWVKNPVCYIDNKLIHVLIDPYDVKNNSGDMVLDVTYIKAPDKFVKGTSLVDFGDTELEINDAMAEELVNLAIIMSTEIVESSRLSTKVNTRPLES